MLARVVNIQQYRYGAGGGGYVAPRATGLRDYLTVHPVFSVKFCNGSFMIDVFPRGLYFAYDTATDANQTSS